MKKTLLFIAAAMMSAASFAQDDVKVSMADENPFKFSADESYVTIFLGDETKTTAGLDDANFIYFGPDGDNGRNLWVWGDTFGWPEKNDLNSFGVPGDYMSVSVLNVGWSGLGYNIAKDNPVNLSFIDSNWAFHMAVKTTYKGAIDFKLTDANGMEAAIALGAEPYESDAPIADFPRDGEWYNIDIPMSYFEDQFEFTFEDATNYADKNYFVVLAGGVEGTVVDYDAVFFHGPKVDADIINQVPEADAINGIKVTKASDNAIYDLTGRRVANATKGIYIQNGKKFIK